MKLLFVPCAWPSPSVLAARVNADTAAEHEAV